LIIVRGTVPPIACIGKPEFILPGGGGTVHGGGTANISDSGTLGV
jgi:hypothetical protein